MLASGSVHPEVHVVFNESVPLAGAPPVANTTPAASVKVQPTSFCHEPPSQSQVRQPSGIQKVSVPAVPDSKVAVPTTAPD